MRQTLFFTAIVACYLIGEGPAHADNSALMAASFAPFKPKVRYYTDSTHFYEESDNMPDNSLMPNLMVGITSWQQQVPLPTSYFASVTNPESSTGSLGYGQPNYWRLPLSPVPSASPIAISSGNFQRGAVAIAANGIAIFNPKNNTGKVSYEIGELDAYGGHCGLADDYHYHIIPTHLLSAFGGVLSNDKPCAWALDGYPIYGYVEPDGTARQTLDADGGHDIGNGWGYHYHAIGSTATDATHPYGTPQTPYLMNNFHGSVVNFGGQVDGQPEVGPLRASSTGGYTASPVAGASIVAFKNPVALTTDGSGNLSENIGGTASADSYLMRVAISGTNYDECWKINRNVNPRTLTITWRLAGATTTTTYAPGSATAIARLAAYGMAAASQLKIPDTSQVLDTTATFGEDADYSINPQSFTDNGNSTITDNDTGLMWQKTDNGESTWETAVANAASVVTGGYTDWRLPTPSELFSLFNHNNGNPAALNSTYFPNNPSGTADYWWTSDVYGTSTTNVWCANAGGGLGGKPKSETLSYSPPGAFRYHARYVRGIKPTNGHNYLNNFNGTITDLDTGLMWTQLPGAATSWDAALTYAENLSLGGFTDWRMPNIKELQTLTDYTLTTATTTTSIKPSINRTMFAKTLTNCTTNGTTTIACTDTSGLLPGMPIVDALDIASTYISNTTAPTVISVTNSTTFVISAAATGSGSGLILNALTPPTAYWSSTSLSGGTSKAWLLETGINNSVLAANGPTRNSQGIISYEAKTSLYPVFAVRTTSVTTQIAVEQPSGTALTDGVSTVNYGNINIGTTSAKTFTIRNNGSTTLSITGTTIDGTNASLFTITSAPASSIAAGGSTTVNVQFASASSGGKTAALHIASSDTSVGSAFDISLTGTGTTTSPAITSIATTPAVPTNLDNVWVNANVQAGVGALISQVQLTYNGGGTPTTTTVFTETMAATATAAMAGWDGTGAINPWTITNTGGGAGNIKQTTAANHGTGNPCGVDMNKGSATATQTMITTTNAINATGTTGYVEFWVATSNLTSGLGWTFQLSTDGATWNTRLFELSGSNHGYVTVFHYDLLNTERVSTLKMRFQFIGNGTGGATSPSVQIDDIKVVTTTGSAAVVLTMLDDGLHNDGAAGDGIYGAQIPAQTTGTTVSHTIAATDNISTVTTSSVGSYTVVAANPVLTVTPATGLSFAGAAGGGVFSPLSATYTLTNSGTGAMSWTAGKTSSWLTLSNASGTLAAGASTPVTASINAANANSLTAATYNDTITFTNSTNGSGNTTRTVSMLITYGTPTAPASPAVATLPPYSPGASKILTWPAVSTATGYTIQIATDSAFTTNVISQTVSNPTAAFSNLSNGVTYYYRVLATNSIGSSAYGNIVFSTQDAVGPVVAITSPSSGTSTTTNTIIITGTSSDALSGISGVKVNNVVATSSNNFATWTATVPLAFGTNGVTATATDGVGNLTTTAAILVTDTTWQTYNPLYIPDVITGTTFNLTLSQKSKQFPYLGTALQTNTTAPSTLGTATTTLGYNGALMWGPTLIMNQGDVVQLNVTNNVPVDTTTVHWHGFHIPAIMDGGPHQVIPSGTTWSPTFTVKNNAATYWYHPHLHVTTQKQLTMGAGGFIIVRDPQEAALALPRNYGVDDIPLALTSRRFVAPNEFGANQYIQSDGSTSTLDNYGDFMLVNGTPTNVSINGSGAGATATLYPPQVSLPKQYVRLRILNAEIQRGYNLGFSDNRTFYVITNDQGLMNAPVPVTRMFLMVGERVEILVNLGADTIGTSLDLKAYNSGQVFGFPGQEGNPKLPNGASGGENGSLLNNTDFSLLHINVAATTANPITALPATLANNTYWTNANVTNTRTIAITGGSGGTPGFKFDNIGYTPTLFNHTINLNAVEKWTVSAGNVFGHALHIHDIKFNIIARTGGTQVTSTGLAAAYESGWKDTVYIPKGESVSVIAKYDDFASNTNPFMFHCHFLNHEDGGMMGQFLVVNNAVEDLAIASFTRIGANNEISLVFKSTPGTTYNLQYSPDMTTGSWTNIGSVTSDGTSANFTETDTTRLAQPRGFYRVVIPSIP